MPGRKQGSTDLEKLKRVRSVQEWMMQGFTSADIITAGIEQWKLDDRTLKRYIKDAYKSFRALSEKEIELLRSFHIEQRNKLLRDLAGKDKFGKYVPQGAAVALDIMQDIAKLQGLYVEKVEVNTTVKYVITKKKNANDTNRVRHGGDAEEIPASASE